MKARQETPNRALENARSQASLRSLAPSMRIAQVLIVPTLAALLSTQGCSTNPWVSIPELDRSIVPYSTLRAGWVTEADVRRELGAPPFEEPTKGGGKEWVYPVRANSDRRSGVHPAGVIPAPILRVQFDSRGVVSDWYFIHPRTLERLKITETVAEARYSMSAICRRGPMTELEAVLRQGRSTMAEVNRLANSIGAPYRFPNPRKASTADGETWDMYVERPSPLLIRPFYYSIEFDSSGVVTRDWQPGGYGGCI